MMLRRRAAITSLALALPAAALLTWVSDRWRSADAAATLERVVRSQVNEQVRERCESDPTWFLTGPLDGRPPRGVPDPNPDALPPRPKVIPQPFELFAYDEEFVGSSPASPRFPDEFKRSLRRETKPLSGQFDTDNGTGVQFVVPTGWVGTTCMYFLGRLRPPVDYHSRRWWTFGGIYAVCAALGWLAMTPMVARARRLSRDATSAAREQFASIAPDKLKDELSAVAFVYNDAAMELHNRRTRINDLDEQLRRHVAMTIEDVGGTLAAVARDLQDAKATGADANLTPALLGVHQAASRLENLAAAARLRMTGELPKTAVDLKALVARVTERHTPLARAAGVMIKVFAPNESVTTAGDDALLERALANIVDNAIRYNRAGGHVTIELERFRDRDGFAVRVTDDGRGVSEEDFRGLTAVRRFRGDEAQNRRPGAPGLGIAVAREVADRFGLQLELRRPREGGFEAVIATR